MKKIISYHDTDWDIIAHIVAMAHNTFPHSSFYLMFCQDGYMPTLFKLLMPKMQNIGERNCHTHLDAMREICMTVLNLKTARDKHPSHC